MSTPITPLTFEPILKPKVWGGRRLARLGKPLPPSEPIGESWELADLPASIAGGRSVVASGPHAGRTLRDVIADDPRAILGHAAPDAPPRDDDAGFPLLVKFLDARENLSVQVHPDEAYVRAHPEAHLKSEAWVVVEAEPGSVIYTGVKPDVTREAFAAALADGSVVEHLVAVPVAPGECHYLPSGTCHALGAGVLVAEVQTPSDTTFRLFDWGRPGREMHIGPALECIAFGAPPPPPARPGPPARSAGVATRRLCRTGFFEIERIDVERAADLDVVTSGMPLVWMVLAGGGRLTTAGAADVALAPGTTVLLPAALEGTTARLEPGTTLLRLALPSPMEGLLA